MSILTTVLPNPVKFCGTKIDMHKGEDITPVLNQTGYEEIEIKKRFGGKTSHTLVMNVPAGFDLSKGELLLFNYADRLPKILQPYECRVYRFK